MQSDGTEKGFGEITFVFSTIHKRRSSTVELLKNDLRMRISEWGLTE